MKLTTIIGLFIIVLLAPTLAMAQKSYLDEADHAMYKEEKYHEAIDMYKKAYVKEPGRDVKAEIIFKIGEAYRMSDMPEQAEVWFEKAIIAQYADPVARLRLAEMKMENGKYDEALVAYQKYAAEKPSDPRGKLGIESAEKAQKWADNPSTYIVKPVVLINSEFYDFSPAITGRRGDEMVFTSTRDGSTGSKVSEVTGTNFSDLYYTQRDKKGKWSEPVLVGESSTDEGVNTPNSEGSATFDSRGNMMYFTRCIVKKNGYEGCQIYKAQKQGSNYGTPELIDIASDSAVVGHPALTPDDKILIFASDMDGGQGGKDLWYIKEEGRRQWSKPINLGPDINTTEDEMFPFVRDNGDLYFASNGHVGMGGLDIFVAKKTGDGQWGEVENMKTPINSSSNDFGIYFEKGKNNGFFTSSRAGGRGKDDIWSFAEPPIVFILRGIVKDIETGEPLIAATVELTGTDGTSATLETRSDGTFDFGDKGNGEFYINPNTSYSIAVSKQDYLSARGKETTVGLEKSKIFAHTYELQPITEEPIKLPEILYDFNKTTLTPQAKDSLNFLYKTLVDNPTIIIELLANTDSRGSDSYNQKLSQGRAASAVDYLVSRGIDPKRMKPKGMGENNLLISDAQINKLSTEEEREAAHQLNRRTEFRIIGTDFVPKPQIPDVPDMDEDNKDGQ